MSAVSLGDGGGEMCLCSTPPPPFFFLPAVGLVETMGDALSRFVRLAERGGIVSREAMASGPRAFLSSQTENVKCTFLFCLFKGVLSA